MSERKPPSPERIERAPPAESFKSKSDARERRYDYYEAHPEHRSRPPSARQIRRQRIRQG
jgi:hypothetical protein